jgi:hypothetical protein
MSKLIEIKGKEVQLREPFRARTVPLVGTGRYIKMLCAASLSGVGRRALNPFLIGEAGLGKTSVVYEFSKLAEKPLFIDQGREDLTDEDLVCTARISDDPDKKIDYILSNLGTAMIVGGIYFADGICKLKPRALSPYESVLDDRRYVDSSLLGERLYSHPGFRFVAATNPEDMEGNPLPEFMGSRLRPMIYFDYPEPKQTEMIIRMHHPILSENGASLLDCYWNLWRKNNSDKSPAPRDSLQIFSLAQNLADYELMDRNKPFVLEYSGTPSVIKKKHMEEAFKVFFSSPVRSIQCIPSR